MPFFGANRASLQLGLLKSILRGKNIIADDLYLNLDFASRIGGDLYQEISYCCDILLGDWLFSTAAFGIQTEKDYLGALEKSLPGRFPVSGRDGNIAERLLTLKNETAPRWLEEQIKQIPWHEYSVVGFSCTFSQIVPSLALAKRIKSQFPNITILMGGSALDADMGREVALRAPWIDCVVQGEGEHAIVEVWNEVSAGRALPRVYQSKKQTEIDVLPVPDYDTYYQQLQSKSHLGFSPQEVGAISFETSRGCWWGEKQHCTFCGLNGETMKFRQKSFKKVVGEMEYLSERYGRTQFQAVDNILSNQFFDTLLPELSTLSKPYHLFFEVKSNLSFSKMRQMHAAGVRHVQPGIESLDTDVLKLMKKGVTGSQNVETLKWARALGVELTWNYLYGFPEEQSFGYEKVIALIPKIVHLQAPDFTGPMRMDRFSPYFNDYRKAKTENTSLSSFTEVAPSPLYGMCYPSGWDFERLAYFFMANPVNSVDLSLYATLRVAIEGWQKRWTEFGKPLPRLEFRDTVLEATIFDTRYNEEGETYALTGDYLTIARCLQDEGKSESQIVRLTSLSEKAVKEVCAEFIESNLVVELDGRMIFLPIARET